MFSLKSDHSEPQRSGSTVGFSVVEQTEEKEDGGIGRTDALGRADHPVGGVADGAVAFNTPNLRVGTVADGAIALDTSYHPVGAVADGAVALQCAYPSVGTVADGTVALEAADACVGAVAYRAVALNTSDARVRTVPDGLCPACAYAAGQ